MSSKHMQRWLAPLVFREKHTTHMAEMKKTDGTRAGSNAEQLEFSHVARWNAKGHNTLENSVVFSYQRKYTFNHITKQFHDISPQKSFALSIPK